MSIKMLGSPAQEILSQIEFDDKENFSAAQIEKFKSDPVLYKKFVKAIEKDIGGAFALVSHGEINFYQYSQLIILNLQDLEWKPNPNHGKTEGNTIYDSNAWGR
jgi:hypothetical protein